MQVRLKIGDVLLIPLPDGRKAYGQYVFWGDYGYLVRIFDILTSDDVPLETLHGAGLMFPPVYVALNPALRSGRWKVVGNFPVKGFVHPKFRCSNGHKPGVYHDWGIWDGKKTVYVGDLPPEYRSLEVRCGWGFELIEERILTGFNPDSRLL